MLRSWSCSRSPRRSSVRCPTCSATPRPHRPSALLIRDLLRGRDEGDLRRARLRLAELFASATPADGRRRRIALVGLRGAGKSTLGHMLADDLGRPFVELSANIETLAGCGIGEIHALYGANAYRRYERRALDEAIGLYPEAVIATPGGLVSDPGTPQRAARALLHGVAPGRSRRPHEPGARPG